MKWRNVMLFPMKRYHLSQHGGRQRIKSIKASVLACWSGKWFALTYFWQLALLLPSVLADLGLDEMILG